MANITATIEKIVKENEHLAVWELYRKAFEIIDQEVICRQGFKIEEFKNVLSDPDFIKCILRLDGKPIGILALTNNLEKIYWINIGYFRKHYPDHFENQTIFYCAGIAIDPEYQSRDYMGVMVEAVAGFVSEKYILFAFDCSKKFNDWLLEYIHKFSSNQSEHIESHSFYVLS